MTLASGQRGDGAWCEGVSPDSGDDGRPSARVPCRPRRCWPCDRGTRMDDREAMLRRIALSDPRLLRGPADATTGRTGTDLDPRWQTLVRLGALLATDPSGSA